MSALLRSGKFLRVISGFARNVQQSQQPSGGPCSTGPTTCFASLNNQPHDLINFGGGLNFHSGIHLANALPYLGVIASDDLLKDSENLSGNLNSKVTQDEIEEMLRDLISLSQTDKTGAAHQARFLLRLCGLLEPECHSGGINEISRSRNDTLDQVWAELIKHDIPLDIDHFNAFLRVKLDNDDLRQGSKFCPESVQASIKDLGLQPDEETYQCLIFRYCQEGNIEGANRILQAMRANGYKVNENIFNYLITGHSNAGDMKSARNILNIMSRWSIATSSKTYLSLCCGYATNGDYEGILKTIQDSKSADKPFNDEQYLDIVYNLSTSGHKEYVTQILSLIDYSKLYNSADRSILKLIQVGHEDVAFAVLKNLNASTGHTEPVAKEFLKQLVRINRPITKLLWFSGEMEKMEILGNGKDVLLEAAFQNENLGLSLKLGTIYVQDRTMNDEQASQLLKLTCKKSESQSQFIATVKLISPNLSEKDLKYSVLPKLEGSCQDIEKILFNDFGITKGAYINTLVEHLVNAGRIDEAKTLITSNDKIVDKRFKAIIRKPSLVRKKSREEISTQTDDTSGSNQPVPNDLIPMIQLYDSITGQYQMYTLQSICDLYLNQGRVWDLENLCYSSYSCRPEDRQVIYMYTLKAYLNRGMVDRAIDLSNNLIYEGLDFPEFHHVLNSFIHAGVMTSTTNQQNFSTMSSASSQAADSAVGSSAPPSAPVTPGPVEDSNLAANQYHKTLKKGLGEEATLDETVDAYFKLEKIGKHVNVTESSSLIELLVKNDRIPEASKITQDMLGRNTYPLPKIFRFLLNRLAFIGDVDAMENIGGCLNSKVKKEVSFDNRLCNAYLAAGQGEKFLDMLQVDLDGANKETIANVQEKFPRGGAMGLLETEPHLINKYSKLAHQYADYGYIAPINVLWTYYFINAQHDLAKPLWNKYLAPSSQIMFQKICQTARSKGDSDMASRLVELLYDARVTPGAQGIAYSCLLDVMSSKNDFVGGLRTLQEGLGRGIRLTDVNRTALLRLKKGLESESNDFPFEIPKKSSYTNNEERSLSPVN